MIIDGRSLALTIRNKIKKLVSELNSQPGLAVILVGDDPASHTYVTLKEKACLEAGIHFEKFVYDENETEDALIKKVHELNERNDINGILVQLPLPGHDEDKVIAAINPKKDVDGFHAKSIQALDEDKPGLVSPVALGVLKLIDATEQDITNKKAVIIASVFFAHPIQVLLERRNVFVEVVARSDAELNKKTSDADILIVAVGQPGLITSSMIKKDAIIIDIGITKLDGKILGDVNADSDTNTRWMTPVPGGVGPMTVAMLLINVAKAYQLQKTTREVRS